MFLDLDFFFVECVFVVESVRVFLDLDCQRIAKGYAAEMFASKEMWKIRYATRALLAKKP